MAEKKKVIRITTPAGIAKYPWLQNADTRFNPKGDYKVDLIIPNADCVELCKTLDEHAERAYQTALADPKKVTAAKAKKKTITKNEPYLPELDEAGNETGNTIFKFKTHASAEIKGETKEFKPSIFDAQGKLVTSVINIYGGSKLKVNFSPVEYYTDSAYAAGCSCRLNAVQVITLVSGGRGNAKSFGFEAEADGYGFEEAEAAVGAASADAPDAGGDTPAGDF